jgi:hypothetical protein
MRLVYAIPFVLVASSAMAQAPTPGYVPIVIEQSDMQSFMQWLNEQPMKFAGPVQSWLNGLEQKAQEKSKPSTSPAPEKKK